MAVSMDVFLNLINNNLLAGYHLGLTADAICSWRQVLQIVVQSKGTNGTGAGGVELIRNATSWGAFSQRSSEDCILQPIIADGLTKVSSLSAVTGRYKTDEEGASRSFLICR